VAEAIPELGPPSHFFEKHFSTLADSNRLGPLLDLACGRGRHAVAAAERGLRVVAIDRNREYLEHLSKVVIKGSGFIEVIELDLESQERARLGEARFGGIIVSRYLHRALMASIESALAPGGTLLYETFLVAQRDLGWGPRRDAFLLQPGELPRLVPNLETLDYEEGESGDVPPAQTARLLARRPKSRTDG